MSQDHEINFKPALQWKQQFLMYANGVKLYQSKAKDSEKKMSIALGNI